jgi:enamine deaminase RidA (YjgF/YER057c/UK114 family)
MREAAMATVAISTDIAGPGRVPEDGGTVGTDTAEQAFAAIKAVLDAPGSSFVHVTMVLTQPPQRPTALAVLA